MSPERQGGVLLASVSENKVQLTTLPSERGDGEKPRKMGVRTDCFLELHIAVAFLL